MWARNLFFLAVILGGMVLLTGSLQPLYKARAAKQLPNLSLAPDEQATVRKFDGLFRAQWQHLSVTPSAQATDLTIMRRLHLALMDTVPSLLEIRKFEALASDDRPVTWLGEIFADRRCADYLAERLARVYVGTEDGPFLIFRRRRFVSWLSDELMQKRPYDEIVRSILSEEGLWTEKPATNFVTVTYEEDKNGFNPERLGARVARAFLGVRLDCAQCHDHPFQPWKQQDFMGLAAYFGQVQRGFTGIYEDGTSEFRAPKRKSGPVETVAPSVPFGPEGVPAAQSRRWQLACWVTDPQNVWFARATVNRVWALLLGRPLVEPVDDIASAGDPPAALDILAGDFASHGYDLRRLIRLIIASRVFQLDSSLESEITEVHGKSWAVFPLTRLRPEQVVGAIYQTGSLETLDRGSPVFSRLLAYVSERDFVKRYGDTGEDEFNGRGGTIPQRLLMMNGQLVEDRTKDSPLNAATQIGMLAPNDRLAVETAYLTVLTRRPTAEEAAYFEYRLGGSTGKERHERMGDLCWTLLNSTEFSWNH
jgi:hypothetical protein